MRSGRALEFRALDTRLQGLREKLLREETQLEQVIKPNSARPNVNWKPGASAAKPPARH